MNQWGIGLITVALMVLQSLPAAADNTTACEAAKIKIAAKYHYCVLKAEAKAVKAGTAADRSRCDNKYAIKWAAAEAAGGGMCPTNDDQTAVHDELRAACDAIVQELSGGSGLLVDNGDGTVSDTDTGLMWEQKDDLGGLHDHDNFYSWSASGSAPDGTAFTVLLAALNNSVSGDGYTVTGCFAGHCDWRLPTIAELETILLAPFPCATNPCIDPIFGPPDPSSYWSATTNSSAPVGGWYLFFGDGTPLLGTKSSTLKVRAVRGGS